MRDQSGNYLAVIKVVGVGGGGTNAVNRMVDAGLTGVEFIAVNTDAQALMMSDADMKMHIGSAGRRPRRRCRPGGRRSRGAGEPGRAEGGPEGRRHGVRHRRRGRRHRNRRSARSSRSSHGRSARSRSASSRSRSSSRAGSARSRPSSGIESLRDRVDTLIVIENDRLLQVVEKKTSVVDAFRMADDILRQGVQGITDLITVPGLVNLDFADVRTIMRDAGSALMGIGDGLRREPRRRGGAHRRLLAAARDVDRGRDRDPPEHHRRPGIGLFEVNEAAEVVTSAADQNANVIFGAVIDDAVGDEVRVTVIATGFGGGRRRRRRAPARGADPGRAARRRRFRGLRTRRSTCPRSCATSSAPRLRDPEVWPGPAGVQIVPSKGWPFRASPTTRSTAPAHPRMTPGRPRFRSRSVAGTH